jgi:aminocarboxymuconate-semialdehyde decarboxylase
MSLDETKTVPETTVVDIHAHLVPEQLFKAAASADIPGVEWVQHPGDRYSFSIAGDETRILRADLIDVEARVDWMDRCGIDLQVVGTWADIFGYSLNPGSGVSWANLLNETLREAVGESDRLYAFASLPMQAPSAAADMVGELIEAGFVGVTFAARIEDKELDDQDFEPVWSALSDQGAAAFIHPGFGELNLRTRPYGMVNAVGRPVDTAIAAARLLGASVPERFPGMKLILAHGGGATPFILGRLQRNHAIDPSVGDPISGFNRLYFDSVVFDPDALCYLTSKASPGSVMLGSDYPFPIGDPSPMDVVDNAPCLTETQKASIFGGAARDLLRLREPVR